MCLLRRALLLLGLLAGLFAMHGLAPAAGTDVLAAGAHQHPAALLALPGLLPGPATATADPPVTDAGMSGRAMRSSSGTPSSGAPAPGRGGHGSHRDGLCLAVLAGAIALLVCLVVLGRRGPGTAQAVLPRPGAVRVLTSRRPPDLARLCVLRV